MLLQDFLKNYEDPAFATAGLYIVKMEAQENQGDTASWRCGRSGTMQLRNADGAFGSSETRLGMYSRAARYYHSALPLNMRIFAFLRIKQRLVAREGDRLGEDSVGNAYSINSANQTEVMQKEKLYHQLLDAKKYRDPRFPRSELFQPGRNGLAKLLAVLRSIEGLELYIFSEDDVTLDTSYRGGRPQRLQPDLIETSVRETSSRVAKAPSITLRMSRQDIEALKSGSPNVFERLVNIFREIRQAEDAAAGTPHETIRLSKTFIKALKGDDPKVDRANACAHLAKELMKKGIIEPPKTNTPPPLQPVQQLQPAGSVPPSPPPSPSPANQPLPRQRPSTRLNPQLFTIDEAQQQPPAKPPPRRSPRNHPS